MEQKTKVHAEDGRQELTITREFDLPVNLLFRAYTDAMIVAQWMGTKVLKLENRKYGGWEFETRDKQGNVAFKAHGTIHDCITNHKIVRTFEMEHSPFDVQLEFLNFEALTEDTSKLTIHSIYKSAALRDQMLKMPFEYGLNRAHDRLQEIMNQLK